jgi:dihydrofolate synthase/folylpolyglutamate synthase
MRELAKWLSHLNQLPRFSNSDLPPLEKVKKVASFLKIDSFSPLVITIAGTNGKGSCASFLDNILRESGYKVGVYTSPHLLRYNERICINGEEISDDNLLRGFSLIDTTCRDLKIKLNYFEFTTLTAFWVFKQHELDVLLLEVGLGGRFDPVNVISPDVSVITTISLDHVDSLGDTREKIGWEKAGIMRKDKFCVCGDNNPPQSIYLASDKIKAPLFCLHRDFEYGINKNNWDFIWYENMSKESPLVLSNLPFPALPIQNAATALAVIKLLEKKLYVNSKAISSGIKKAFLPGRFQWLKFKNDVKCVVDVAHNAESALLLAENLKSAMENESVKGKIYAVMSALKDKDIVAIIRPLVKLVDIWFVANLVGERAAELTQLQGAFDLLGLKNVLYFSNINQAFSEALRGCSSSDKIVCYGSFYVAAEILKINIF